MSSGVKLELPAIDPTGLPERVGTFYPDSVKGPHELRRKRTIGDALGLTHYGVNLVTLPPGAWSALRHWHQTEDEFVYVLEGDISLVTNIGEQVLGPGMAAGFPAGKADGHHLINRGTTPALYLEVGNRTTEDDVGYPDDDLSLSKRPGNHQYSNKKGEPLGPKVTGAPGSDE